MKTCVTIGIILALTLTVARAQLPKRPQIPGAIPIGSVGIDRPLPLRRLVQQQPLHIQQQQQAPIRQQLRRPIPNAIPAPQPAIRPVVEEPEDALPVSSINLNEEVARLSQIPIASSTPRQQQYLDDEDDEPAPRPYTPPVQFRPERPPIQVSQPVRAPPPQPIRQAQQQRSPAPVRQVAQPVRRPQPQYADEEEPRNSRRRKPEVKILRKYREDNEDGSITWGFENDDGTFKEENIGIDCITRGKYGYIDPDGNRREYTYETGLKCDHREEELPEEALIQPQGKLYKRPPQQQIRLQ